MLDRAWNPEREREREVVDSKSERTEPSKFLDIKCGVTGLRIWVLLCQQAISCDLPKHTSPKNSIPTPGN